MSDYHYDRGGSHYSGHTRSDYSDHSYQRQRGFKDGRYDRDGPNHNGYARSEYPDHQRPRQREPNDRRQEPYEYRRQNDNVPRRRDNDKDSTYGSSHSAPNASYWESVVRETQKQLDEHKEELNKANAQIEEHKKSDASLQRELKNVRDLRDEDAQEIDRLRMALGEQYVHSEKWSLAVKELKPHVERYESLLKPKVVNNRPSKNDHDLAQRNLYDVQFLYAKALSHTGQEQLAIDLFNDIYKGRKTHDKELHHIGTRDAQQELCAVLERSRRQEDRDKALDIVSKALAKADHHHASPHLPWIADNRLMSVRLLARNKKYSEALSEARRAWDIRDSVREKSRKAIEKGLANLIQDLQEAHEHEMASHVIITTMTHDSRVSDAGVDSFARLSTKDLFNTWRQCSKLQVAERHRIGWKLALRLSKDRRYADSAELFESIPVPPGSSAATDQHHIDDARSQVLVKLTDFSKLQTAAKLAAALFKEYGISPLPERQECYHVETLLKAVEKLSRDAGGRSDSAKLFEDMATQWWQPVYQKRKDARSLLDRETLSILAQSGRELRGQWKDDALLNRAKKNEAGKPERQARDAFLEKVKVAEKWAGVVQK